LIGIELWVGLAIGAALAQTTRNLVAQTISSKISPALNSWSRFAFCLPFAAIACGWTVSQNGLPALSPSFFIFCLVTAITQLLGNVALVSAFRIGSFGESIVFHKLEVVLTAIVGAIWFAEFPTTIGSAGIGICALGVIVTNLARKSDDTRWTRAFRLSPAGGLALLCAVLLVFASFALKSANSEVLKLNLGISVFESAVQTLFHTTWIEVLLLSLWIAVKEPQSFRQVPHYSSRMLLIGTAGFTASLGWFWAFSLSLVAYVKAVGQIEAIIAVALGIRLMGERELVRQIPGILMLLAGITLVLFG
jgi:drug/metabolite transporter (DMT)-like permease